MAISQSEMTEARKVWGDALVAISKAYLNQGIEAAVRLANEALDEAYGYELGPVLFKPTLASGEKTFRTTREGALSYFVGENPDYPDTGFALKGWCSVKSETAACFIEGDVAMWMGSVTFTDRHGKETIVDKSWGYKKGKDGKLRIVLHHSSLPYKP
ncbi:MAG: phosphoribosyl-AMP cyclohydrolase [Deltaproteobacteria bacterium]|nr:phosphoribosyl-AMP cyclohydrolase [Deltaproteobacteria bacterium]